MAKLEYVIGDATNPQVDGCKVICHICNDMGRWGAGFVLALSRKWMEPERDYLDMDQYKLGDTLFVPVEPGVFVCNMIAQHDTQYSEDGLPPVRYGALYMCLDRVANFAKGIASVHMPLIGCGLAGGYWPAVKSIITETLLDAGIDVYVYLWEPTVADFMMMEPKASINTFVNGEFAGDPGSPEFYHIEPWKIEGIHHEGGTSWNLDVIKPPIPKD
jgi:O-acetyl-ADP-ribose deacetylase (regulator of RNase III)